MECFTFFTKKNHSVLLLCRKQQEPFSLPLNFFLSCVYADNHHKKTPQAGIRPLYDFTFSASPFAIQKNSEFSDFINNEGVPYLNPVKDIKKWAIAAANAKRLVDIKPNDLYTVPKMENTPTFPVTAAEQGDFPGWRRRYRSLPFLHRYVQWRMCISII